MRDNAGHTVFRSIGIHPRDEALEREIDEAWHELATGETDDDKLLAFLRMKRLIAQRSAARIAQMERERGLS